MKKTPKRIRLSRAKGWKMPAGTIKVDRSTRWGNPFVVGRDGPAGQCCYLYAALMRGQTLISGTCPAAPQKRARDNVFSYLQRLRGKNLACWCGLCERHRKGRPLGSRCRDCAPCHADILLAAANAKRPSWSTGSTGRAHTATLATKKAPPARRIGRVTEHEVGGCRDAEHYQANDRVWLMAHDGQITLGRMTTHGPQSGKCRVEDVDGAVLDWPVSSVASQLIALVSSHRVSQVLRQCGMESDDLEDRHNAWTRLRARAN